MHHSITPSFHLLQSLSLTMKNTSSSILDKAMPSSATTEFTLRIEPTRGFFKLDLAAVWEYRELLYFLVWRDVKVRYKQTALGAAWAIIQPFLTMVVFSIFFGSLGK